MNKNYVPSSSHAKFAEELQNGDCSLLIDTVQDYFAFKYTGLNTPIYIDPLKNRILNVNYINDVNVKNLVAGINSGYGINVVNEGNGMYVVNVEEDKFALKEDLQNIDDKFTGYITIANFNQRLGEGLKDTDLTIAQFVHDQIMLNINDLNIGQYVKLFDLGNELSNLGYLTSEEIREIYTTTEELEII